MDMLRKKISLLASAILFVLNANAQEGKVDTIKLSLNDAIVLALDENPTVRIAEMDVEKAHYVVREGKSALWPTVEGALSYNYNIQLPVMFMPAGVFGEGGAMRMGYDNGFSASATATVPIYMATIYRNIAMTKEQLAMTVETARSSKINMVNEVKTAYYNILLTKNSYKVLLENKVVLEKTVNDIESKFKQGMTSEYDLLTAKVQLQNLLPTVEKTKSALEVSNYMLKVLLSLPLEVGMVLTDEIGEIANKVGETPLLENVELDMNTDIKMMEHQIKLQEHSYKLSRANRIPSIFASTNYTHQSQSNDFKFADFEWAGASYVAVGVSVPIFAGFKNKYKDKQILIDINKAKISRDYAYNNIKTQAYSLVSNIVSAKQQIASNRVALEQAKKAFVISETRFKVGAGTILEMNSAQVSLMQAELNLTQSIYDLLVAYSSYDVLIGKEYIEE